MMNYIKKNKIKCNKCSDEIESKFTHDFVWCKCKSCAVDGGLQYMKRCGSDWTEMSETIFSSIKKIFCIMGYTSSGKTTISNEVSKQLNVPILVSHSNRPKRNGEIEGKDYYFVDDKFFEDNEYDFLEKREYNVADGSIWKYGLHASELIDKQYSMFVVDKLGYCELCEKFGDDKVISILIEVSEEELRSRHYLRGDSVIEFNRRIEDDINRFKGFISDYIIYNDKLDIAANKVKEIIKEEMEI